LPLLRAELEAGRLGVFAAFRSLGARVVPVEFMNVRDERGWPEYRWFWNVNSPVELEKVEGVLTAAQDDKLNFKLKQRHA
jgi:hypothetical protein